jgi:microcystin-dependent protein
MPRNSAGTYSLPESPFIPNTAISSSAVNSDLGDIADAITDSLSRDGQGGMNAKLGLALSGFNYTSDPDTGMSRSAANTQAITCGGEDWTFSTTDFTAPDGSSLLPLIGEIRMWALPTAPTGWLLMQGQACTTIYPLWRAALIAAGNPYGTSGGDPLFPNMQCVVPAGVDGTSRGLLTGSTVLGALLGEQSRTLITGNLPAYTPSGTVSKPTVTVSGGNGATSGLVSGAAPPTSGAALGPAITAVLDSTPVFSGDAQGGTSTAFGIVQPTIIINFIGRAA